LIDQRTAQDMSIRPLQPTLHQESDFNPTHLRKTLPQLCLYTAMPVIAMRAEVEREVRETPRPWKGEGIEVEVLQPDSNPPIYWNLLMKTWSLRSQSGNGAAPQNTHIDSQQAADLKSLELENGLLKNDPNMTLVIKESRHPMLLLIKESELS